MATVTMFARSRKGAALVSACGRDEDLWYPLVDGQGCIGVVWSHVVRCRHGLCGWQHIFGIQHESMCTLQIRVMVAERGFEPRTFGL